MATVAVNSFVFKNPVLVGDLLSFYAEVVKVGNGSRGFQANDEENVDSEAIRDAKGWLSDRMITGYAETTDQPAFAAKFDLQVAYERVGHLESFAMNGLHKAKLVSFRLVRVKPMEAIFN